jgi:hypothetical protein
MRAKRAGRRVRNDVHQSFITSASSIVIAITYEG